MMRAAGVVVPRLSLTGRSIRRRTATGFERYANLVCPFMPAQQAVLLHPEILDASDENPTWNLAEFWRDDLDPRKSMQWVDLNTTLPDGLLTRVDRAGMAHSLEVRPPLLDHRVVEFALRLAPDLLRGTDGGPGKLILRRLMAPRLPPGHLDRPQGRLQPAHPALDQDAARTPRRRPRPAGRCEDHPPPAFRQVLQRAGLDDAGPRSLDDGERC